MNDSTELARQLGAALGDRYIVERPLGEGGFAVVFLVRDLTLKRNLAVKVLSPDMITSRSVLDRFRREAETVAQLSHPNIVPLHFIGQQDDLLYLVMQCVEGGSIADRLQREGALPVSEVTRISRDVASALAHAHKRGVIHRDIKPANVLIDPESGRGLVTDFGIARSAGASALTATGMMIGTPAYLSPEQVTGEAVDHRVDIFALGVMMYEMLAGRVPYDAPTPSAAMMKRLGGPPEPVKTLRKDVPAELSAVINACLAADPADRIQTAGELCDALGGGSITTGARATRVAPVARRPLRAALVAAGVVVTMALAGAGWWYASKGTAADRFATAPVPTADSAMITIPAGVFIIGTETAQVLARPRHRVSLSAFAIERTEVTVADYRRYVNETGATWTDTEVNGRIPATHVPWREAVSYCAWKYKGGRLPTEFEWEAAARGGGGRTFPWGEGSTDSRANTASFGRRGPVPVGSFPNGATPEGVQDMIGNVWEWTGSTLEAYAGGAALPDSMTAYRVSRGGAFDTIDSLATASLRGRLRYDSPGRTLLNTGFRCVVPAAAMAEGGRRP